MKLLPCILFLLSSTVDVLLAQAAGGPWNPNDFWCALKNETIVCGTHGYPKCNVLELHRKPFDGVCFAIRPLQPFFYVHDLKPHTSPWQRKSQTLHCGEQPCDQSMSVSDAVTVTQTRGSGTQTTTSNSHTDTTSESFAHGVKLGLEFALTPVIKLGGEDSFTYTNQTGSSNTTSNSKANSKTYSYAVGKTFTISNTVTCHGLPHQELYVDVRTYSRTLKGNSCTNSGENKDVFECKYMEILSYAVVNGNILDADLRCVNKPDPNFR